MVHVMNTATSLCQERFHNVLLVFLHSLLNPPISASVQWIGVRFQMRRRELYGLRPSCLAYTVTSNSLPLSVFSHWN